MAEMEFYVPLSKIISTKSKLVASEYSSSKSRALEKSQRDNRLNAKMGGNEVNAFSTFIANSCHELISLIWLGHHFDDFNWLHSGSVEADRGRAGVEAAGGCAERRRGHVHSAEQMRIHFGVKHI